MNENNKAALAAGAANTARLERAQTFEEYREALVNVGPKLKELILDRAAHDPAISLFELRKLVGTAYPDGA